MQISIRLQNLIECLKEKKPKKKTLWRIFWELFLPTLAALVYWFWPEIQDNNAIKKIGISAVAFSAIMFIQEQLQRVLKQERDLEGFNKTINSLQNLLTTIEEKFDTLDTTLDARLGSVKDSIEALRHFSQEPSMGNEEGLLPLENLSSGINEVPEEKLSFRTTDALPSFLKPERGIQQVFFDKYDPSIFISEANRALRQGSPTASLLTAGLGFENALKQYATSKNVDVHKTGNSALLQLLKPYLYKDGLDIDLLRTLVIFRNRLAHAEPADLPNRQEAESVLDRYSWAINALNKKSMG